MMPRSVLFVVHGFPPHDVGGVEVYTRNLANEMASLGINVTVLYPSTDSPGPDYSITFDTVGGLTLAKFNVPIGSWLSAIISQEIDSAFSSFLESHDFDLVHFHHINAHLSISMIARAKEHGVPVALTLHDFWFICLKIHLFIEENGTVCSGPESTAKCTNCLLLTSHLSDVSPTVVEQAIAFRLAYVRDQLLNVDLLFSPSDFVAKIFNRFVFGVDKITVAPIGIGKFSVNRSPMGTGIRFGYMGTIHPIKNIFQLVKAFTTTHGQASLDIYGGGKTHWIQELNNGISDIRITYHGSYTPDQLSEILSTIDILVVPSFIESYCLTAREALSAGIPVLAARVGGLPEIICEGINGILFDPFNQAELPNLLQKIISNPDILQTMNGHAIPVMTIADDTRFLIEQYTSRIYPSDATASKTNMVKIEQQSELADNILTRVTPDKIKVAVFSLEDKDHACSHYRILAPFGALRNEIEFSWCIELTENSYNLTISGIELADLIVVQRFFPRPETADLLRYLCSLGKPIIFEIDDLLTDLPPTNPHRGWGLLSAPHIYEFVKKCSAVTVSTEYLKKHFLPYNDTIHVLPNLIDTVLWSKASPSSSAPVVIGYAGTPTHNTDLTLLEEVLEGIAVRYGNKVAFTFMGCQTERISRLPNFSYIQFEMTFADYAMKLQDMPIDVMLVPLEDNPFNRAKSNIKWLEYSSCGIAGIYADLPPYNSCITHGSTGILVDGTPGQWFSALEILINNSELRQNIANAARSEVLAKFTLKAGAHRWVSVYEHIIATHQSRTQTPSAPHRRDTLQTDIPILVSIIIPVFNKAELTERCLKTLIETTTGVINYEIIIINNGSTDQTPELLAWYGTKIKVISNGLNRGFASACNQGASAASGEYLLFLNNDTELQPGWLEPLVATLDGDPSVAAVGSKLLFPDGTIQHAGVVVVEDKYLPDPLVARHIYYQLPSNIKPASCPKIYQVLTAACFMVRQKAFAAVGGFDEAYWNGYEDVDLCFKLGQAGWKLVYMPSSVVIHHESQSGIERFSQGSNNIKRLHQRWLGIITPDIVVDEQGIHYEGPGITTGLLTEYLAPINGSVKGAASIPQISIIVPVFNKVEYTRQCVESLLRNSGSEYTYEIIIVDNGSTDGTKEYLHSLGGNIHAIRSAENRGFACACNQGAHAAHGEFLVFLNNDTVVQSGWLGGLMRGAINNMADIVGAKLLYPDNTVQHAGVAFGQDMGPYHIFNGFKSDDPAVSKKRFMQAVTGACILLKRAMFLDLGCFDEKYMNGFEDLDLCLRAGERSARILYTPESVVIHFESASDGRTQHNAANLVRFNEQWGQKFHFDDEEIYRSEGIQRVREPDGRIFIERFPPLVETPPLISIIIPQYGLTKLTQGCISSLLAHTTIPFEVIVSDDASPDNAMQELTSRFGSDRRIRPLVSPVNTGFAATCNRGARAALGRYLCFLNNDTEVTSGWLEPLISMLGQHPNIGMVGPKLLFPDGTIQHCGKVWGDDISSPISQPRHIYYRQPSTYPGACTTREYNLLTAACILVRRDEFLQIGPFDEGYENGWEDDDLCCAYRQAGMRLVYCADSTVIHYQSKTLDELKACSTLADPLELVRRRFDRNRRRFFERWGNLVKQDDTRYYFEDRLLLSDGANAAESSRTAGLVSIVILTFNQLRFTQECVASVKKCTPEYHEIIFVDNGSTDGTVNWLKDQVQSNPSYRLIDNGVNLGFAKGCNQGAWTATTPYIIFLNNDTIMTSGWLESMFEVCQSDVGIVGCRMLYPNGTIQHAGIDLIGGLADHPFRHAPADLSAANVIREIDMVTGACLLIKRELFLQLGGFDEVYLNGVEDVDLCLRVREAGRTVVYQPNALIYHHEGLSAGRFDHVNQNLQFFNKRWQGRFDSNSYRFIAANRPLVITAEKSYINEQRMHIIWQGTQFVYHSLALVNRELCQRLIHLGHELSIMPYETDEFVPETDSPLAAIQQYVNKPLSQHADAVIRHQWPPDFNPPREGHWVMIQPWEYGSIPVSWVEPINSLVDEVWAYTSYVRDCYVESGVNPDKVHIVPLGVDTGIYQPGAASLNLPTQKSFRFLFVGGTIHRKGIDLLLAAYRQTFTAQDDVCLVIKDVGGRSFYQGQTAHEMIKRFSDDPLAPEIMYIDTSLTTDEMAALYRSCHCLVHPYRGEGFGLPIAEAMASGLPVIVTGQGAALDFCPSDIVWLIPAEEIRFATRCVGGIETVSLPWLAEPDLDTLGKLMQYVCMHPDETRMRGQAACEHIRTHFTWDLTARCVESRLQELRTKPIVRFRKGEFMPTDVEAKRREVAAHAMAQARILHQRGEVETAVSLLIQQGIAVTPELPVPYLVLVELLMREQRFTDALQVLNEMPSSAERHVMIEFEAVCHAGLGNNEIAATLANQIINRSGALVVLGTLSARSGNLSEAEKFFRRAVESDLSCGTGWLSLGMLLWGNGDFEGAYQAVRRAVVVDPLNNEAVKILRDMAERLG